MADLFESGVTYGEKSWHEKENNLAADDPRRFSARESLEASSMMWGVTTLPLALSIAG